MKKCFFFLFFMAIFTVTALADYSVDSVDVAAEVSGNGTASVTSVIQLTFDTIEREVSIPLPDGDVSRVSVSDHRFSLEPTATGVNVIVKERDGFAGVQSFLLRYNVAYAGSGDPEADIYTLGFLSSRWARDIGMVSFSVQMPAGFENAPVITSGYYGELTAGETSLSLTETSLSGVLSDRMAYDSLSMSLTLPEGYFRVRRTTVPVISVTFLTLGMLTVLVLCILYWRAKLRSPGGAGKPRLLLPEGILPGQLPLVLDGSTVDIPAMILEWANLGYLTISLSDRGAVVLSQLMPMGSERSEAERVLFSRLFQKYSKIAATPGRFHNDAVRFRAATRRSLYPVLFDRKGGNPVLVQLPCRILLAVALGYLSHQLLPEGPGFIILAVLAGLIGLVYAMYLHSTTAAFAALRKIRALTVLCWVIAALLPPLALISGAFPEVTVGLFACLFSAVATAPGPKRSQRGLDVMTQARGCRTFYRQASWQRLQIFQGQSSRFFQTQLPRAVALGVDRQFAQRFERLAVPMPEWLMIPAVPIRSAAAIQAELAPIIRQLREAFR